MVLLLVFELDSMLQSDFLLELYLDLMMDCLWEQKMDYLMVNL